MSKTIEVTFAFDVGDEVVNGTAWRLAVRAGEQYRRTHKDSYINKPGMCVPVFQIIERIAQECPGGVQRHYICRAYVADKYGEGAAPLTDPIKFLEHELMLQPPPDTSGTDREVGK